MGEIRVKLTGPECPRCGVKMVKGRIEYNPSGRTEKIWICSNCKKVMPREDKKC